MLVGGGNLGLGGDEDGQADGDKEPLVEQIPFHSGEGAVEGGAGRRSRRLEAAVGRLPIVARNVFYHPLLPQLGIGWLVETEFHAMLLS